MLRIPLRACTTTTPRRRQGRARRTRLSLYGMVVSIVAVVMVGFLPQTFSSAAPGASGFWATNPVPTNSASTDAAAVELGLKFRSSVAGAVTGVRFYKGIGNGGTHTGSLWSATGTKLLATATFAGETATGWQTASFDKPV